MIYDELKSKYDQLSGNWPEDARVFSGMLLSVIEQLERRMKSLEDQLAQNSRNSSKPPSQDFHRPVKRDSGREGPKQKAGRQKGHAGQGGKLKDNPDKIIPYTLGVCPQCGEDLRQAPLDEVICKQIEDIPEVKTTVVEHRIEVKTCPGCGTQWQAGGCDVQHTFEYGPNVKALSVYLSTYQFIPQKCIKELLGVFGLQLSTGTLNNFRRTAAQQIEPFVDAVRQNLKAAPSAHFDEPQDEKNIKLTAKKTSDLLFIFKSLNVNERGKLLKTHEDAKITLMILTGNRLRWCFACIRGLKIFCT